MKILQFLKPRSLGREFTISNKIDRYFLVNKGDLIITNINSTKRVFHGRELFQVGYHL